MEEALGEIDKIIQDGKDILQFIKDIIFHFRNLMIVKTSKNPRELIEIDEETMEGYLKLVNDINLNFILRALDILTSAEEKAKWSTQPRIILEMAIIQIVKLEEELSLETRIKRLEMGIKSGGQSIRIEDPKPQIRKPEIKRPEIKSQASIDEKPKGEKIVSKEDKPLKTDTDKAPASSGPLNISSIQDNWEKVIQIIKSKKMNVYALLIEGSPVTYENGLLTIGYNEPYGFHKDAINSPQNKEFVESILTEYFKKDIVIKLVMGEKKSNSLEDIKKNTDDAIKEVIDFFGKDIVEIK